MSGPKFSVIDTEGISKPLTKLIEAVSSGIGRLYEPTRIRKEAGAKADALVIATEGDIARHELLLRAADRLVFQEERRQYNIESVVALGMQELPGAVSDEPVDPDWISRFFAACQDVSHEQLQILWAKILAGEVAQPGSCSRKTLSILQDLSPEDALCFRKLCSLAWYDEHDAWVPLNRRGDYPWGEYGLTFADYLQVEAAGLVHTRGDVARIIEPEGTLAYHDRLHMISPLSQEKVSVACLPLTQSGIELRTVSGAGPNPQFYQASMQMMVTVYRLAISMVWETT